MILLLAGCAPSAEEVSQNWTDSQNELRAIVNQIEQLKSLLPAAWEADLATEQGLTGFMEKDAQVKQNLSQREELLQDAQSVLDRLNKLNPDYLSAEQQKQTDELSAYFDLVEPGISREKDFFHLLASGEYDDDTLMAHWEAVTVNRTDQQSVISEEVLVPKPSSADPAEQENETGEPVSEETTPPADAPVIEAKYRLNQTTQLFEPIGDHPAKAVLLTFDDVPITGDAKHALAIAETLKENDVPAVFFVYGAYLNSDVGKETVKQIYDLGFALGNHSQNHPDLTQMSAEGVREELKVLNDQLIELTGEPAKFFRPPYGITNPEVSQIAQEMGMLAMNWTYGYDWETDYQDASALAEIMVESPMLTSGANLLMHDRKNTAEAIDDIIQGLSSLGYGFIDPAEIAHE